MQRWYWQKMLAPLCRIHGCVAKASILPLTLSADLATHVRSPCCSPPASPYLISGVFESARIPQPRSAPSDASPARLRSSGGRGQSSRSQTSQQRQRSSCNRASSRGSSRRSSKPRSISVRAHATAGHTRGAEQRREWRWRWPRVPRRRHLPLRRQDSPQPPPRSARLREPRLPRALSFHPPAGRVYIVCHSMVRPCTVLFDGLV